MNLRVACLQRLSLFFLCLFTLPLVASEPAPPRLMLATVYQAGIDVSEYWISEKLDGVRGHWDGNVLRTRGGHRIHSPAWFTADWPRTAMDGELWIGRDRFEEISGIVRSINAGDAAWRQVRFMIFDLPDHAGPFADRVVQMRALTDTAGIPWLRAIPQFRLDNAAALDAKLNEIVAAGGEGLMLHHQSGLYRVGRSNHLLKYKPYEDAEARVIGYTEGRGKYENMLGALIVERPDGLRFRLGSGFTDAQRLDPPPIGSHVTYRFNGLTANGTPRFARFLRLRHDLPPADPE